jgi:predicted Ser/Thr protein kinase
VNNIYESDNQFAIDFEKGYKQKTGNILRQVAEQIQSKVNGSQRYTNC